MNSIETIKKLLEERNWTKYKLGKEAGLPQSTITSLFSGRVKSPSEETLKKIADALGVSVGYLLGEEENKKEPNQLEEAVSYFIKLLTNIEIMELRWRAEDDLLRLFEGIAKKFGIDFKVSAKDEDKYFKIAKAFLNEANVEVNVALLEGLQDLAEQHNVWVNPTKSNTKEPYQFDAERSFIKSIDLDNDDIRKQFKINIDGDPLSEEEIDRLIAFVRVNRQFDR